MNLEQIMAVLQIIKTITEDSSVWIEIFPDGSGQFSTLGREMVEEELFSFGIDFLNFYENFGKFLAK